MKLFAMLLGLLFPLSLLSATLPPAAYNVKDFGATGNKEQKATAFLQAAIDSAHAHGGGTVYLPPGEYLSGTIVLRSHVTLWLEAGATLFASTDPADYQVPFTIYKGAAPNTPVLVYAERAEYIAIRGKGIIHGQAQRVYEPLREVDGFIQKETEMARQAGVEMKMYYKVPPYTCLVYLVDCTDITITDVSLMESSDWTLHLQWCERAYIRGVYIYSSLDKGVNADGIDVDGSRNVTISDCIIETGDDAIVLKTTLTNGRYEACENITVSNCILTSTSTALKLGTESHGDFRHIVFNNCVIRNSNRGLSIVVRDGATVSDVLFSNISIQTNRKHFNWWGNGDPIWLVLLKRQPTSRLGSIRNITFQNIQAQGQGTSRLQGFNQDGTVRALENIRMQNVQLHMEAEAYTDKRATHAFEATHVHGLDIDGLKVEWAEPTTEPKWASAAYFSEVENLKVSRFEGRQGLKESPLPVLHLHNVRQAALWNLFPSAGASTLLRAEGSRTAQVIADEADPFKKARKLLETGAGVPKDAVKID